MAIKITNLQQISDEYAIKEFVYSDLHLDITKKGNYVQELGTKIDKVDLKMDYDESAIRNSLRNLFNTRPGQRILFPEYGLDLHRYVFEAVTEDNARLVGERIVNAVKLYEPRVTLKQCLVNISPEDNQYDITIIVEFPVFNTKATLNTKLDTRTQTFVFVESNKH